MSTPSENTLEQLAARIAVIMQEMSDEAIAVICRRLAEVGELSPTDAYTLARLAESKDLAEINAIIQRYTELADAELKAVYETLATINDDWAKVYYNAAGVQYQGWAANPMTRATVYHAYATQASGIINLSRTSAFSYAGTVKTVGAAYTEAVNKAVLAVTTGTQDYRRAISKTIRELSQSGLRAVSYSPGSRAEQLAARGILSVEYPSGRTLRLDSAVRMNTMDGFRGTMNTLREQQGREFGADGYEVSAHALCAPDHLPVQGRQYTYAEYDEMNGNLQRPIGTMNCKHVHFPVIVGVSPDTYSDAQLKAMAEYSDHEVTWNGLSGKEMTGTRYDATQYQRQLEASLRTKKSEAKAYAEAGDDTEARRCRSQARALQVEYRIISEQMGLATKPWRTR